MYKTKGVTVSIQNMIIAFVFTIIATNKAQLKIIHTGLKTNLLHKTLKTTSQNKKTYFRNEIGERGVGGGLTRRQLLKVASLNMSGRQLLNASQALQHKNRRTFPLEKKFEKEEIYAGEGCGSII